MKKSFIFVADKTSTAEVNVGHFIEHCKNECVEGGTHWENLKWPEVKFTKLGAPKSARGVTLIEYKLPVNFIEFAKAFFWYAQSYNSQATISFHYLALRVLESALNAVYGNANIWNCSIYILDQAAVLASQHYTKSSPYQIASRLQDVAVFLATHRLTEHNIKDWKSPIRRAERACTKIGKEAEAQRHKKLPDEEALNALATIFSCDPQLPRDILVTSFFAMSMCAPQRASEILALPVSAEINPKDDDGVEHYGWRFFSNKGYEGNIKWVPKAIEDIGRTAFERIRKITEPGRQLAKWIEDYPDHFYRHANCPDVAEDQFLTVEQAAWALGFNPTSRQTAQTALRYRKLIPQDEVHTLQSLWTHVLGRLPQGFPWLDKEKKIRFSEALFCTLRNQAHATRGTIPIELQILPPNFFVFDLGPREGVEYHKSLFDRHSYMGTDGRPLKLTTHQPRHLLNTIAQRAGLSQEYIARWSGRANPKQNRTYNHTTDAENVSKIVGNLIATPAPNSVVPIHKNSVPVSQDEFLGSLVPTVHVTEYGYCVHNFVISPCLKYRDCINCSEQVCIKGEGEGEGDKLARLELRLSRLEAALALALLESEEGIVGVDRWVAHHQMTINRIKQMIEMLSGSDLPDGSILRLTGNNFSHIRRAMLPASKSYQLREENEHGEASFID